MSTITPYWRIPPDDLELEAGDVHVWRLPLAPVDSGIVDAYRALLDPEERQRADRFLFERHRNRFTVCRGALRILLSRYLSDSAGAVRFAYEPHGKPTLQSPSVEDSICFNLAHSRDLALLAFSRGQALGIDIEYQRPMPRAEALARRFFSKDESDAIQALEPHLRQAAFYRCWTRKEAFIKATGDGFSFPLDRFSVTLAADEPVRLTAVTGAPEALVAWSMTGFAPSAGYQGALVVRGGIRGIYWWEAKGLLGQQSL